MKFIKHFNLNEALGVSKPSIILVEFLSNRIYQDFIDFFESGKDRIKIEDNIKWKTIRDNLSSDDLKIWKSFPVVEFILKIRFQKNVNFMDRKSIYSVGGEFSRFSNSGSDRFSLVFDVNGDPAIRINMGIDIEISDFFSEDHFDDLFVHIKSTILHEMNHAYEYYMRDITPDQYLGVACITLKNPDSSIISDDLFHEWENFTYLLYYSDPIEINAMSQESLGHIEDSKSKGDFNKIPAWIWSKKMIQFSANKTISSLLILANNDRSKLDLLKDALDRRLKTVINADKGSKWSMKLKDKFQRIDSLSWDQLIKNNEKGIQSSGKRLKKNILRLFSYSE